MSPKNADEPLFEDDGASHSRPPNLSKKETYNLVTDVVTGVNLRGSDNLIQGLSILAALPVGALVGAFLVQDRFFGALVGGFCGVLAGLFLSGIGLMVYRTVRHLRGRHD